MGRFNWLDFFKIALSRHLSQFFVRTFLEHKPRWQISGCAAEPRHQGGPAQPPGHRERQSRRVESSLGCKGRFIAYPRALRCRLPPRLLPALDMWRSASRPHSFSPSVMVDWQRVRVAVPAFSCTPIPDRVLTVAAQCLFRSATQERLLPTSARRGHSR